MLFLNKIIQTFYIVLYDNGSIDNSQALLENYENVINIKFEKNINIVDVPNHLLSNYGGNYYFGLYDDALPLKSIQLRRL